MPDSHYKEVFYYKYCKTCVHAEKKNTEDPCHECLSEFTNLYSHKPVKYEEAKPVKKKEEPNHDVS